jgi:hypothetical protein
MINVVIPISLLSIPLYLCSNFHYHLPVVFTFLNQFNMQMLALQMISRLLSDMVMLRNVVQCHLKSAFHKVLVC